MSLNEKLQQIVDYDEIAENIALHARGIDRSDGDLIRRVYHPDGEVAYGFVDGTANDLAEALGASPDDDPMTLHRPSNVWIEIDGDRAKSETYIFAYVPGENAAGPMQAIYGGRYLDRHEKRNGKWLIAHRTYVLDWNVCWPPSGTADPDFDASMFVRGGKRGNDIGNRLLAGWAKEMNGAKPGEQDMSNDLETRANEALAKQDIHQLIAGQARGTDRGDKALLQSLFHPGATINAGVFEGPAEEFCNMIVDFTAATPAMSHTVSNEWIQVKGNKAIAETYVIAYAKQPDENGGYLDQFTGGRYLDQFEKRDGAWKYVHRTFVMDWQTSEPTTDQGDDGMLAMLKTRGGKYPSDPLYAFLDA